MVPVISCITERNRKTSTGQRVAKKSIMLRQSKRSDSRNQVEDNQSVIFSSNILSLKRHEIKALPFRCNSRISLSQFSDLNVLPSK
jgi:hypothetical protein